MALEHLVHESCGDVTLEAVATAEATWPQRRVFAARRGMAVLDPESFDRRRRLFARLRKLLA